MRWFVGKPRSKKLLFSVGPYLIDKFIHDCAEISVLRLADAPEGEASIEGEQIYLVGTVTFLRLTWRLSIGVIDNHIHKITLYQLTPDKTAAGVYITAAFAFCKELYGEPAEDNGRSACWHAANGDITLQTNAGIQERPYFVSLFLSSSRAGTFKPGTGPPDADSRWGRITAGFEVRTTGNRHRRNSQRS